MNEKNICAVLAIFAMAIWLYVFYLVLIHFK